MSDWRMEMFPFHPTDLIVELTKEIDEDSTVEGKHMDFSKGFNNVLHGRLVQKVTAQGKWGVMVNWI